MDVFDYLIYAALAGVSIVLAAGIYSLFRGGDFGRSYSNKLMRLRVLSRRFAIAVLVAAAWWREPVLSAAMVTLNRIYTRLARRKTGWPAGPRSASRWPGRGLWVGRRDQKRSSAWRASTQRRPRARRHPGRIQNELLDLGADLATRPGPTSRGLEAAHPGQPGRTPGARDRRAHDRLPALGSRSSCRAEPRRGGAGTWRARSAGGRSRRCAGGSGERERPSDALPNGVGFPVVAGGWANDGGKPRCSEVRRDAVSCLPPLSRLPPL